MSNQQQRQMMDAYDDAQKLVTGDRHLVLPEGTRFYEVPSNGVSYIDVVPYVVTNNPKAQPGQWAWVRGYDLHRNLGLDGKTSVVCPRASGGKCPICETAARLSLRFGKGDAELKKAIEAFNAKSRSLYDVIDLEHPDLGIQVFDVSHFLFTKLLSIRIAKASQTDRFEANWRYFADPEQGLSLKVTWNGESFDGNPFWKASSIDFRPREQQYDAMALVEMSPVLDDCITILEYDAIVELLAQTPSDLLERDGGSPNMNTHTTLPPARSLPVRPPARPSAAAAPPAAATPAKPAKAAPKPAKATPRPAAAPAPVVDDTDWNQVPEGDGVEGEWVPEGVDEAEAFAPEVVEGDGEPYEVEGIWYNADGTLWVEDDIPFEEPVPAPAPAPAPARPAKAAPRPPVAAPPAASVTTAPARPAKAAPRPPVAAPPAASVTTAPARPAKAAPRPPAAAAAPAAPARPAKAAPRPPGAAAPAAGPPARPAKAAPRPPAAAAADPNFVWE